MDTMSSPAKAELKALVQSLIDQDILNSQFTQLQALRDQTNPDFVVKVVDLFCSDAQNIIKILIKHMSQEDTDFHQMDPYVHQLRGCTSSIGAQSMTMACADLCQAFAARNKKICLKVLHKIECEYFTLYDKLRDVVQLEKQIFARVQPTTSGC
ncbi:Histidine phosphotransferase [Parasponia andersonii]|uniref:Histidine-containing phosphotransfer protein n=1 Tax=Parasponia andersonii TaxID=3476 RepID=A0A2P5B247_PARAD|nr:Histidine phosphotransferase [Parasponia andersonii]